MKAREPDDEFFIVEGRWAVEAVVDQSRFDVLRVVVESGRHSDLSECLLGQGIVVNERDRNELLVDRGFEFHRGIYAEVARPRIAEVTDEDWSQIRSIVVPYGLADPGNLGTVVRAAAGFGADAIFFPENLGADPFNRKCIRASATAIFRVPLFTFRDTDRLLEDLGEHGFVRFSTSLDRAATPLSQVEPAERMALFFGGEASGLPSSVDLACEERVRIPMESNLDSLNVGASAAVVLYELLQRKRNTAT